VQAIVGAVREAELSSGCEIRTVVAGIGGSHIKGVNSHGLASIRGEEVTTADVEAVLGAVRSIAMPSGRAVLETLPREFAVDGWGGIQDPTGIRGEKIEVRAHVVTMAGAPPRAIMQCCQRAGLHVARLVFAPLASAYGVLTREEQEDGIALIDIGAGGTGVVAFTDGSVAHASVVPVAGNHVTNDLAAGLKTPFREAERLKRRFGSALPARRVPDCPVEVPKPGGGYWRASLRLLNEVIEPRVEEILLLARRELERTRLLGQLRRGVTLAGGTAVMDGVAEAAERVFDMPARVGRIVDCEDLDETMAGPACAAAIGLARAAVQRSAEMFRGNGEPRLFGIMRRRLVGWLTERR